MICKNCNLSQFNTKQINNNGLECSAKILLIVDYPNRVDETLGCIFSGEEDKIFQALLNDAFNIKNILPLNYMITSIVKCRPTDTMKGATREPTIAEILACMPKLMHTITKVKPKIILLSGDLVKRFYSKEFPDAYIIQPMGFLLKQGGVNSPWYRTNLRIILQSLK